MQAGWRQAQAGAPLWLWLSTFVDRGNCFLAIAASRVCGSFQETDVDPKKQRERSTKPLVKADLPPPWGEERERGGPGDGRPRGMAGPRGWGEVGVTQPEDNRAERLSNLTGSLSSVVP